MALSLEQHFFMVQVVVSGISCVFFHSASWVKTSRRGSKSHFLVYQADVTLPITIPVLYQKIKYYTNFSVWGTSALPVHYHCNTIAIPLQYHCRTNAIPEQYQENQYSTIALPTIPIQYHCSTIALPEDYQKIISTLGNRYISNMESILSHQY